MRILWLDNDKVFLRSHMRRLRLEGHHVDQVAEPSEALSRLDAPGPPYDLLILDVMLPWDDQSGPRSLPVAETNLGRNAGLVFYRRFLAQGTLVPRVLVLTQREDLEVSQEFCEAGLPERCFMTKSAVADSGKFISWVRETCIPDGEEAKT